MKDKYKELPNSDVEDESDNDYNPEDCDGVIMEGVTVMKKVSGYSSRPQDTYFNSVGGADWRTHGAIDY